MKKVIILLALVFIVVVGIMISIGLSQEPPPQFNYTPLTLQEHQKLFDAPENGFHELLEAMDGMVTPSDTVTNNSFEYRNKKVFSEGMRPLTTAATESSHVDGKVVF